MVLSELATIAIGLSAFDQILPRTMQVHGFRDGVASLSDAQIRQLTSELFNMRKVLKPFQENVLQASKAARGLHK